jgi:hypothetical protein
VPVDRIIEIIRDDPILIASRENQLRDLANSSGFVPSSGAPTFVGKTPDEPHSSGASDENL